MAVKINQDQIKELLLAKGDKIALGVGGGVAGLLLVWGVVSAFGAPQASGARARSVMNVLRIFMGVAFPGARAGE